MKQRRTIILSVGGSLIAPDEIRVDFLKQFRKLVLEFQNSVRFLVVAGGGCWARRAQAAVREIGFSTRRDLDEVGIEGTRMNARLLLIALRDVAYPKVLQSRIELPRRLTFPVTISGGWTPGQSSDGVAVDLALALKLDFVANLTNVAGVFPKTPTTKEKCNRPIESLSFGGYFDLVGRQATSGEHVPFGIVAAKKAQRHHLRVLIISGLTMAPLRTFLKIGVCVGTTLSNEG